MWRKMTQAVLDLGVRLAGGEVMGLCAWVGDEATWVKSAIWAHSADHNA